MLTKRDPNIFISLSIYDEAIIELISMSSAPSLSYFCKLI